MVSLAGFGSGMVGGAAVTIVIRAIDDYSAKFGKAQNSLAKFSKAAVVGAGIIAASLAAVTKVAISFESAFAGVRKTVELSEGGFQDLRRRFKDLSREIPVSFVELSRIGELAGQLGVQGVNNLEKFTETVAAISVTTNLTSEEAATGFARLANIMQEPIENVDRMGSAIVDLGNNFATTEKEILDFSLRVAAAGNIAGLSTADVMAIGTAFSSVGVAAERGGTAVQKVLTKMTEAAAEGGDTNKENAEEIKNTVEQIKSLERNLKLARLRQEEFTDATKATVRAQQEQTIKALELNIADKQEQLEELGGSSERALEILAQTAGLASEEFRNLFKEKPSEAFEKFVIGLGDAGDKAFQILRDLGLGNERVIQSFLSLANAPNLLAEAFDKASEATEENVALMLEAEKRYATTESKITTFKNNIAALADDFGSIFKDKFETNILEPLNTFLNLLRDMDKEAKTNVVNVVTLIGSFLGLVAVIKVLSVLFSGIGPAGAAGLAALVLGAAVVVSRWESIKKVFSGLISFVMGLVSTTLYGIGILGTHVLIFLKEKMRAALEVIANPINFIIDKINFLIDGINLVIDGINKIRGKKVFERLETIQKFKGVFEVPGLDTSGEQKALEHFKSQLGMNFFGAALGLESIQQGNKDIFRRDFNGEDIAASIINVNIENLQSNDPDELPDILKRGLNAVIVTG